MGQLSATALPPVSVTHIGDFIRHRSCERWLKLTLTDEKEIHAALPFFERLSTLTMDPVLQEAGRRREDEWEQALSTRGLETLAALSEETDERGTDWQDFRRALESLAPGQSGYGREIKVGGQLGEFRLDGRIDFVLLTWQDGRPCLRLVECKASRKDRTYHRIQVAAYRRLVRGLIADGLSIGGVALDPADVEVCVVRVDEETNESQDILDTPALDDESLLVLEDDLDRLLSGKGAFQRVLESPVDELPYQLDDRCNDCFFAVHCFTESARQRRLELLGLSPAEVQSLKGCGIETVDHLADLDLAGPTAAAISAVVGLALDPQILKKRASTRRATMPGAEKGAREVESLRGGDLSLLPEHQSEDRRLIRVYLAVDYDYSENRIGALSAHVTSSDASLHTGMQQKAGKWQPDPELKEKRWLEVKEGEKAKAESRQLSPRTTQEVVEIIDGPGWSGDFAQDSVLEQKLVESFFAKLVTAISQVTMQREAPLHFYVWDKTDIGLLIDACLRLDSEDRSLLSTLRGILGSRGHTEQVIYSSLSEEMRRRFATAYTGEGLIVAAGMRWKGDIFHWHRKIGPNEHDFAKLFAQDLFDFKARLALDGDEWAADGQRREDASLFEIRGRFKQGLTAPYWRAYWKTLADPRRHVDDDPTRTQYMKRALEHYNDAARPPSYLKTFLKARVQALRWLEERMTPKNKGIVKPLMDIKGLHDYSLEVEGVAGAALDFLSLEHYVKLSDWTAAHLAGSAGRVALGRSLPLKDVYAESGSLVAQIDAERYCRTLADLEGLASFGLDSFVRVAPCSEDPARGQTIGQLTYGKTCRLVELDWASGQVRLEIVPSFKPSPYLLPSFDEKEDKLVFDYATLDESPADFVAGLVESRLEEQQNHSVCSWLDPKHPAVPVAAALVDGERIRELAAAPFISVGGDLVPLAEDQQAAVLEGLETRIQLLQGPPGTGKTQTTAAAALLRILARREPGDVVCIAANTHLAVDTLLERIDALQEDFTQAAASLGFAMPRLAIGKVRPRDTPTGNIEALDPKTAKSWVRSQQDAVMVVGGTTNGMLRLARQLDDSALYSGGFRTKTLIVDEASMLVFPHLLALCTLLDEDGEIMLAGDNRQLSPIVAHDWQREDRAPVVAYTPFASAYDAVQGLAASGHLPEEAVRRSALSYTFRLPPEIRRLLGQVYRRDDIELRGREEESRVQPAGGGLAQVWDSGGVYLVLHDERASQQANAVEVEILNQILTAAPGLEAGSIGVVTPHRAQRSLLKSSLAIFGDSVAAIDTVERFQGGEAETIFVSACASDPAAISARAEFLLDLNRANVAFSRAKKRLFVIVSESLLDHIPHELELYQSALLWKSLRQHCQVPVCELEAAGHRARIFAAG